MFDVLTNDPELIRLLAPIDARIRAARDAVRRAVTLADKIALSRAAVEIEGERLRLARAYQNACGIEADPVAAAIRLCPTYAAFHEAAKHAEHT